MAGKETKPNIQGKPSLIAAAQSQVAAQVSQPPTSPHNRSISHVGPIGASQALRPPSLLSSAVSLSRPGGSGVSTAPFNGDASVPKMKFKPRVPARVKSYIAPEPSTTRGGFRGRGRGMSRPYGRSRPPETANMSVAAGPMGGGRPVASSGGGAIKPRGGSSFRMDFHSTEVYSDDEERTRSGIQVIDIDAVSGSHDSAPTSLFRDRLVDGGKLGDQKSSKRGKGKKKQDDTGSKVESVKDEPMSPLTRRRELEGREDDTMLSEDEQQDRDAQGRRLRRSPQSGELEVNEAQAVDLSESDSEEEELDMEGDFVETPGHDTPDDRLFMFQFPQKFPSYVGLGPIDVSQDDVKPDVKPTAAALRAQNKLFPPPEGRVGTMVVYKSGKVKLVMGDDIVMDVTPGANDAFISHLVHMDKPHRTAAVLGEVYRQYYVTPDVDGLLDQLHLNGGETPGDRLVEARRLQRSVKQERGLVKMERD
ncbi:hypothetical protein TREMEDRAFT_24620 [Tremella mesenterica DSM 1558]|uniref:uncharacterized protein n=1 Tax=Tremella mesenterica (strain ATCC 24925 / CBS 8224 / DSM 1558 / NBRC 9311 / NRRL Y-6157 / RJB 2259-6 / UBC 559-6) TaxID=578456 RepID=UPI0003F49297|nr:uncharacterized protein TREMEDRAFT_24620 [Tremella mesenterica DSM 1558]EIW72308.1 hypothetical protein TREMEDRAFT_24620 [Tremella mesenterica DSM 1558]